MRNKIQMIKITRWFAEKCSNSVNMALLSFGLLIVLFALSACGTQRSKSEAKETKSELTTMLNSLYVPQDAVQLAEKITYGYNPVLKNCEVTVTADIAYQSPRDFRYVLDDYQQALAKAGWKSSPDYRHDQADVDFFDLGSKFTLTISAIPLNPDVEPTNVSTVALTQTLLNYYLQVTVSSPSIADCRAG